MNHIMWRNIWWKHKNMYLISFSGWLQGIPLDTTLRRCSIDLVFINHSLKQHWSAPAVLPNFINLPTPLHASLHAARIGCCDRSTWLVACPGHYGGLLVLSQRREMPWRRCTRAVLRSGPEWLRPAAYSRIQSPTDESETERKRLIFIYLISRLLFEWYMMLK